MDILFNMRAFVSVAETGSFTAAAQRLDRINNNRNNPNN